MRNKSLVVSEAWIATDLDREIITTFVRVEVGDMMEEHRAGQKIMP